MAIGFWNKLGEIVWFPQDFEGQKQAQWMYQVLITVVTVGAMQVIGFIVTCVTKQFMYTGWAAVGSTLLAIFLVAPNWPYLNRVPLKWSSVSVTKKKKND